MAEDTFEEIEAKVAREYAVFDRKRKRLVGRYRRAEGVANRLSALAAVMRHHGEYVNRRPLSGWMDRAYLDFADQVMLLAIESLGEIGDALLWRDKPAEEEGVTFHP